MADPAAAAAAQDALTARLTAVLTATQTDLEAQQRALAAAWPTAGTRERLRRLRGLRAAVTTLLANAAAVAQVEIPRIVHGAYTTGATSAATDAAQAAAAYLAVDTTTLRVLADQTWTDLLQAARGVETSTKTVVRQLAADAVRSKLLTGRTAVQAADTLTRLAAGDGITAIVYRDGSRHRFGEYAQMLVRTRTAEIYQQGALEQTQRLGIEVVELLDGPFCGLTSHDDPQKADGLLLPVEVALRYRIAHPNCRRVSTPRPDVTRAGIAAAQAAARAPIVPVGLQRLPAPVAPVTRVEGRAARSGDGTLTPAAGAATTPAGAGRAAAITRPARPTRPVRVFRP